MTNGARVIDSTPPAMAKSISPERMARAASPTALRPEAHSRFTVTPGIVSGKPGQQQRHARDVAVVLAGLIGAAEKNFVEPRPIGLSVAGDQRLDRHRGEIVGAHLGERAAITADGGARGIANEDLPHRRSFRMPYWALAGYLRAGRKGSNGANDDLDSRICRSAADLEGRAARRSRRAEARARGKAQRARRSDRARHRGFFSRCRRILAPSFWPAKASISAPGSTSPS